MTEKLLAPLRDVDIRPTRVDLGKAVRVGRRRRRIRHAAIAGLTAAVVLATAVAVNAVTGQPRSMPADRTPVPLPTSTIAPPLGDCTPGPADAPYLSRDPWVVLDDTWRVAVHLDAPGTAPVEAVRYMDGRVERIPGVPSRLQVALVNRAGDFAGIHSKVERGWVYRNGRFTELKLPGGATHLSLIDINETGDILGSVDTGKAGGYEGVVWPAGHPDRPRLLKAPAGKLARGAGIAWDGSVVGVVIDQGRSTPYLWHPDGTGEPLPVPAELGQDVEVSNLTGDWAVGPKVRWNIRTRHADVINGMDNWSVVDVYGRVFGTTDTAERQAVVWINGTVEPLPADFKFVRNDGRQLLGQASTGEWIRWTC
jgi:hypothetical protein